MTNCPGNKTVLIIEDDVILLELFDEILAESFSTRTANNLNEAMDILRNSHVDAIVSDYHLKIESAELLIEWLMQEMPELVSKLILLTGELNKTFHHRNKIASVLFKPVDFNILKQEVHALLDTPQRSL